MIYKNVSIEGPNGIIRSGSNAGSEPSSGKPSNAPSVAPSTTVSTKKDDKKKVSNKRATVKGYDYKGCFGDAHGDRVFSRKSTSKDMTNKVRCTLL